MTGVELGTHGMITKMKENEKAYVKSKEPKIRIIVRDPNKVTYGHTPSTPKRKKEKRIRREFCD